VISGFNRYVRNPMYIGVVSMIVGQGLLFGRLALLLYALVVWAMTAAFVRWYEDRSDTATIEGVVPLRQPGVVQQGPGHAGGHRIPVEGHMLTSCVRCGIVHLARVASTMLGPV
jgi:phospholipid methyltransferase